MVGCHSSANQTEGVRIAVINVNPAIVSHIPLQVFGHIEASGSTANNSEPIGLVVLDLVLVLNVLLVIRVVVSCLKE